MAHDIRVKLPDNINLAAWNIAKQIALDKGESRVDLSGWILQVVARACEEAAETDPIVREALKRDY
jgi:hypothetical protein